MPRTCNLSYRINNGSVLDIASAADITIDHTAPVEIDLLATIAGGAGWWVT